MSANDGEDSDFMPADSEFYHATITKRVDFAPLLWSIRVNPGGEFKFRPGQYATLGVEGTNKLSQRAYSIVSSPHENEVEFFFELVPGGELTSQLYKLHVGDEILMRKVPKGRFLLDTGGQRKNRLLISTVTGVAPFLSYIRSLVIDDREGKFPGDNRLFSAERSKPVLGIRVPQRTREHRTPRKVATYVPTISRAWEEPTWNAERGRVDDLLRKYIDEWRLTGENALAYLCGHPEMIEHSKGVLRRKGFPKEAIGEETYWIQAKKAAAA